MGYAGARCKALSLLGAILLTPGLLALPIAPAHAEGIRKIVDAKGKTFYTNEAPENDGRVAPPQAPAAAAAEPLAAVSAIPNGTASEPTRPSSATAPTARAPASLATSAAEVGKANQQPLDLARALGDWPPKSMRMVPPKAP